MGDDKVVSIQGGDYFSERGAGPPSGGDLEKRMQKVEGDLAEIKILLATLGERMNHLATKEDVGGLRGELRSKVDYKWSAAFAVGLLIVLLREEILSVFRTAT